MPDLPHRYDHEEAVAYGFASILNRQRRELASEGIERAVVDEAAYKKHQDELALAAYLLLLRPWEAANDLLLDDFGQSVSAETRASDYRHWAEPYSRKLADNLVTTNRKVVRTVADKLRSGEPLTVDDMRLTVLSTPDRAAAIGTTETTRAASAGEFGGANRLMILGGRKLLATWHTSRLRPEATCKICLPLDNQPENVWIVQFPMGPPGHSNCRCFLSWRIV